MWDTSSSNFVSISRIHFEVSEANLAIESEELFVKKSYFKNFYIYIYLGWIYTNFIYTLFYIYELFKKQLKKKTQRNS